MPTGCHQGESQAPCRGSLAKACGDMNGAFAHGCPKIGVLLQGVDGQTTASKPRRVKEFGGQRGCGSYRRPGRRGQRLPPRQVRRARALFGYGAVSERAGAEVHAMGQ
eukprot:15467383-Alexandrium_andersonii.AAC.1